MAFPTFYKTLQVSLVSSSEQTDPVLAMVRHQRQALGNTSSHCQQSSRHVRIVAHLGHRLGVQLLPNLLSGGGHDEIRTSAISHVR